MTAQDTTDKSYQWHIITALWQLRSLWLLWKSSCVTICYCSLVLQSLS